MDASGGFCFELHAYKEWLRLPVYIYMYIYISPYMALYMVDMVEVHRHMYRPRLNAQLITGAAHCHAGLHKSHAVGAL